MHHSLPDVSFNAWYTVDAQYELNGILENSVLISVQPPATPSPKKAETALII